MNIRELKELRTESERVLRGLHTFEARPFLSLPASAVSFEQKAPRKSTIEKFLIQTSLLTATTLLNKENSDGQGQVNNQLHAPEQNLQNAHDSDSDLELDDVDENLENPFQTASRAHSSSHPTTPTSTAAIATSTFKQHHLTPLNTLMKKFREAEEDAGITVLPKPLFALGKEMKRESIAENRPTSVIDLLHRSKRFQKHSGGVAIKPRSSNTPQKRQSRQEWFEESARNAKMSEARRVHEPTLLKTKIDAATPAVVVDAAPELDAFSPSNLDSHHTLNSSAEPTCDGENAVNLSICQTKTLGASALNGEEAGGEVKEGIEADTCSDEEYNSDESSAASGDDFGIVSQHNEPLRPSLAETSSATSSPSSPNLSSTSDTNLIERFSHEHASGVLSDDSGDEKSDFRLRRGTKAHNYKRISTIDSDDETSASLNFTDTHTVSHPTRRDDFSHTSNEVPFDACEEMPIFSDFAPTMQDLNQSSEGEPLMARSCNNVSSMLNRIKTLKTFIGECSPHSTVAISDSIQNQADLLDSIAAPSNLLLNDSPVEVVVAADDAPQSFEPTLSHSFEFANQTDTPVKVNPPTNLASTLSPQDDTDDENTFQSLRFNYDELSDNSSPLKPTRESSDPSSAPVLSSLPFSDSSVGKPFNLYPGDSFSAESVESTNDPLTPSSHPDPMMPDVSSDPAHSPLRNESGTTESSGNPFKRLMRQSDAEKIALKKKQLTHAQFMQHLRKSDSDQVKALLTKQPFVDNEADVEDDEFKWTGGVDGDDIGDADAILKEELAAFIEEDSQDIANLTVTQLEERLLADESVREFFQQQMQQSDLKETKDLVKDIATGRLATKRKHGTHATSTEDAMEREKFGRSEQEEEDAFNPMMKKIDEADDLGMFADIIAKYIKQRHLSHRTSDSVKKRKRHGDSTLQDGDGAEGRDLGNAAANASDDDEDWTNEEVHNASIQIAPGAFIETDLEKLHERVRKLAILKRLEPTSKLVRDVPLSKHPQQNFIHSPAQPLHRKPNSGPVDTVRTPIPTKDATAFFISPTFHRSHENTPESTFFKNMSPTTASRFRQSMGISMDEWNSIRIGKGAGGSKNGLITMDTSSGVGDNGRCSFSSSTSTLKKSLAFTVQPRASVVESTRLQLDDHSSKTPSSSAASTGVSVLSVLSKNKFT